MSQIIHDKPEQLQQIQAGLLQGEEVYAVYDCIGVGTGFIGITNMRVILQDKSFVGNKLAVVSIPYKNIRSHAVEQVDVGTVCVLFQHRYRHRWLYQGSRF